MNAFSARTKRAFFLEGSATADFLTSLLSSFVMIFPTLKIYCVLMTHLEFYRSEGSGDGIRDSRDEVYLQAAGERNPPV
jgi:hypothetical protein